MTSGGWMRRWLMSVVFCVGGAACELRQPLAGACALPVRALPLRRLQRGG